MAPQGMKEHFINEKIRGGEEVYYIINNEAKNILYFIAKFNPESQIDNESIIDQKIRVTPGRDGIKNPNPDDAVSIPATNELKIINILSACKLDSKLEYRDSGNTCSEEIALFLAEWFHIPCKFTKEQIVNLTNLAQLDIFLPLSKYSQETQEDLRFISGNTEESCFNFLSKLDPSIPYLVRTGENNRAGHNQIVYHSDIDGEWHAYDSVTHQVQLTTNGKLTDDGVGRLVKAHAIWGEADGESSIIAVQATKEGAEKLIEFINISRCIGDDAAIEKLYS